MEWENAFEPLRDFFRRRKALARFRQLPVITVQGRPNYYRANTSPSPDWDVRIINEAKEQVGTACYALTPLNDQLWLYRMDVNPEHRREGYGLAFLDHLNRAHGLPITAIHEKFEAIAFWNTARLLDRYGLTVTPPMSDADITVQQKRWAHLEPLKTRLLDQIHARFDAREKWEHAISRGLDE